MGNLPLQVVDPFSERLATLAWKKLDHKQNQNTIDIILFIIITTCFYFDQENDSHKTQSSIMIFLYMPLTDMKNIYFKSNLVQPTFTRSNS